MAITTTEYARQRGQRARARVVKRSAGLATAALVLVMSPGANAYDWRFVPNVNLTETLTDNVSLSAGGTKEGDLVTQVSPGFTLSTDGPRLKARINYSLQANLYATSGRATRFTNQLNAGGTATLIRDMLYVDATAFANGQSISAFAPQSFNNVNATGNQANVHSYSISPYLFNRYGSFATSQLRYTHEAVGANTSLLANTNTDRLQAIVSSGPQYIRGNWGLQASTEKKQYSDIDSISQSSISANAGYLIVPTVRLTATGGYEKNTYVTLGDKPEGKFYNAGFTWAPTTRTSLTATAGRRYFGNTYFLAANHRARNTVFSLNYSEDITSTQGQFVSTAVIDTSSQLNLLYTPQIADPAARQQFVDLLIRQFGLGPGLAVPVNSLTNRYFLQKSLQGSIAVSGAHSTVIGTVFDTRREAQSVQITAPGLDDSNKQIGASAAWNLQLSPRSSALANLSYTRSTSLVTDLQTTYKIARVGMTTTFRPKLTGTLELRHTQQASESFGGDIRENAITASVFAQF
jgi:uncharacterized protein (PEP-CTERM system associated)